MFLKRKSKILPVKNDASVRLGVTPRAAADHAQVRFSIDFPLIFDCVSMSFGLIFDADSHSDRNRAHLRAGE